ncbi:hypothetical protein THAOC_00257, partial [Thalassiosira oceanica]
MLSLSDIRSKLHAKIEYENLFLGCNLMIASRVWALHPMFWGPLWGRGPSMGPVLETPQKKTRVRNDFMNTDLRAESNTRPACATVPML